MAVLENYNYPLLLSVFLRNSLVITCNAQVGCHMNGHFKFILRQTLPVHIIQTKIKTNITVLPSLNIVSDDGALIANQNKPTLNV